MANVKCEKCGTELIAGGPQKEYETRLLDSMQTKLLNCVLEMHCPEHPEVSFVSIPDLPGLVTAAAVARAMLPRKLSGADIRFMRKALKWPSKKLADKLQVTPEAVSRWENGKSVIEPSSEKLLRMVVGFNLSEQASGVDFAPEQIAAMRIESMHDPEKPLIMEFFRTEIKLERNKPREKKWMPEQRAVNE